MLGVYELQPHQGLQVHGHADEWRPRHVHQCTCQPHRSLPWYYEPPLSAHVALVFQLVVEFHFGTVVWTVWTGPHSYSYRSLSLWNEVLQVPKSACLSTTCYLGVAVQAYGSQSAAFTLLVANASEPVYLVRASLASCRRRRFLSRARQICVPCRRRGVAATSHWYLCPGAHCCC